MALTQQQLDFIKSNVPKGSTWCIIPPNITSNVTCKHTFEEEIANRICKELGRSYSFIYADVTSALLGRYDGCATWGLKPEWVENVWLPAQAVYPNALITDPSILR